VNYFKEFNDNSLFFVLLGSVYNSKHLDKLLKLFYYATTNHYNIFDDNDFYRNNINETNVLEYILPAIKKVYSNFFINPPTILMSDYNKLKLELFQYQFDLEEFLIFLSRKFIKNFDLLNDFEFFDKNCEIITLIIQEYTTSKYSYVSSININDIKIELRDIKIKRLGL